MTQREYWEPRDPAPITRTRGGFGEVVEMEGNVDGIVMEGLVGVSACGAMSIDLCFRTVVPMLLLGIEG